MGDFEVVDEVPAQVCPPLLPSPSCQVIVQKAIFIENKSAYSTDCHFTLISTWLVCCIFITVLVSTGIHALFLSLSIELHIMPVCLRPARCSLFHFLVHAQRIQSLCHILAMVYPEALPCHVVAYDEFMMSLLDSRAVC